MWKLLAISTAVLYAMGSLALRKYELKNKNITGFQIFFTIITIGFLITMLISISVKKYRNQVIELHKSLTANKRKLLPDFLFWLSFVSIIYFFGDFAYFESHVRVPHIAYLLLIGTVVNGAIQVMGSSLFFNEHLHPKSYFAIALILIGAALL